MDHVFSCPKGERLPLQRECCKGEKGASNKCEMGWRAVCTLHMRLPFDSRSAGMCSCSVQRKRNGESDSG